MTHIDDTPRIDRFSFLTEFQQFLKKACADGWIESFQWGSEASRSDKSGGTCSSTSKTHKVLDGHRIQLTVFFPKSNPAGIDLEINRGLFWIKESLWVRKLLDLSPDASDRELIQDWSLREACFKAAAPNNAEADLFDFKKTAAGFTYARKNFEYRYHWHKNWIITLARESSPASQLEIE